MQNTLSIARRQFVSYFNGPVAYIVASIVLGAVALLFWNTFFLAGRATASQMFQYTGLAMVFAVPAITMGLIADERESGTLEILMTLPVRESEVILGKFLGAFGLILVIITLTFVNPFFVSTLGNLDWGPVATGYVGLILQAAAMLSIGIMASAWTWNQLVSFFVSFAILAIFGWMVPAVLEYMATGWFATFLSTISLQEHLESMTRGVIDSRDVIYFLSIAVIGLMVAFRGLESRRWS
jgi:ABC-2 type transport system permease protein